MILPRALLVLAAIALPACDGARDDTSTPTPRDEASCPMSLRTDPARAARILGLLRSVEAGRDLFDRVRPPLRLCFGPRDETAVMTDGTVLLDARVPEAESAARLGHLLLHHVEGFSRTSSPASLPEPSPASLPESSPASLPESSPASLPEPSPASPPESSSAPFPDLAARTCDAVIEATVAAEARAHALELELRRALGVSRPAYPFDADFWITPPGDREAMLRAYFLAHPDGAPGVPGFVSATRRRCEASAL